MGVSGAVTANAQKMQQRLTQLTIQFGFCQKWYLSDQRSILGQDTVAQYWHLGLALCLTNKACQVSSHLTD